MFDVARDEICIFRFAFLHNDFVKNGVFWIGKNDICCFSIEIQAKPVYFIDYVTTIHNLVK